MRPAVTVILPFHGSEAEAAAALETLAGLELREGDEILVADNTADGVAAGVAQTRPGLVVFATQVERSAYAARNEAAERARNEWLLFVDADCVLPPDLLDRYFAEPPAERTGAVAGQVLGVEGQPGVIPEYIRSRRHLDQEWLTRHHSYRPMAVTANLLVRREAWQEIGGFAEGTRSGADSDFSWRLQDAGWALGYSAHAAVHHEHRASLAALLKQTERDGAGGRWASRRWPGHAARPNLLTGLARAIAGALVFTLRGDPRRGLFKLIDGAWLLATAAGSLSTNAAPVEDEPAQTVALVGTYPEKGTRPPSADRVEALRRADRPDWSVGRAIPAHFAEDDGAAVRLAALARLLRSRPQAARTAARAPGRALALAPAALRLAKDPAVVRLDADRARQYDAVLLRGLAGR